MSEDNLGFVSPYLLRPPRSRIEAAYDLAPELRDAVEVLQAIATHYPLIHEQPVPAWIRNADVALAQIEAALEVDPSHPVPCSRCGEPIAADCEVDGCEDSDCTRAK